MFNVFNCFELGHENKRVKANASEVMFSTSVRTARGSLGSLRRNHRPHTVSAAGGERAGEPACGGLRQSKHQQPSLTSEVNSRAGALLAE